MHSEEDSNHPGDNIDPLATDFNHQDSNERTHKRKRQLLSIPEKLQVIERLKRGESRAKIASEFKIGRTTVFDIMHSEQKLLQVMKKEQKINSSDNEIVFTIPRKRATNYRNDDLQSELYEWYVKKIKNGENVTSMMLTRQAESLAENLGESEFEPTRSWMQHFKRKYGITLKKNGSEDSPFSVKNCYPINTTSDPCYDALIDVIKSGGYDLESIYTMDEMGLHWKVLPETFVWDSKDESEENRLSLFLCVNAAGTHKIPVTVVGTQKKPHFFENTVYNPEIFPINYFSRSSSWVDAKTVLTWFNETFISSIIERQKRVAKKGKILLLVDSAFVHSSCFENLAEVLINDEINIRIGVVGKKFGNLPLCPRIISLFRKNYRSSMIHRYLMADDFAMLIESYEKFTFKDCLCMLVDVWENISQSEIERVWQQVFRFNELDTLVNKYQQTFDEVEMEKDLAYFAEAVRAVPGLKETTDEEVRRWLKIDREDFGHKDIFDFNAGEESFSKESEAGPSHLEAYEALTVALKWFEKQKETGKLSINRLKRIQDLAEAKAMRTANIYGEDFFE